MSDDDTGAGSGIRRRMALQQAEQPNLGFGGSGMDFIENPDGTNNVLLITDGANIDPRIQPFLQPAPDGSGRMVIPSNVYMTEMNKLGHNLGATGGMVYAPLAFAAGLGGAAMMGAGYGAAGLGAAEGLGAGGAGGALGGATGGELALGGGFAGGAGGGGALAGEGAIAGGLLGGGSGAGLAGGAAGGGALSGAGGMALSGLGSTGGTGMLSGLLNPVNDALGTNLNTGQVLSGAAQAGLGTLGANAQSDAYSDVANQNLAIGAPYRGLLEQSYGQDFDLWSQPGYSDALGRAADISSRSWSARAGNPAGSPTAQAGIYRDVLNESFLPALSNYRGQLGQFGGLGLSQAGQAQMGGAQSSGGIYDALGYGLGTAMNQQTDWTKILQGMGGGQQNPYSLNIGGMKWGG